MHKQLCLVLACLLLASSTAQAKEGPVVEWLAANPSTTLAAKLLSTLVTKPMPASTTLTLFAPTNKAIETFLKDMGLTAEQFLDRKALVDLVVAYHIIPGYQANKDLKLAKSPASAATGDLNMVLRLRQTPKGVVVTDLQDNEVAVTSPPVHINKVAVVVIDRVLMSGSYFLNGKDALTYYPQWGAAAEFAAAAGFPENTASGENITLFVPDDEAFKAISTSGLSKEAKADIIRYHVLAPARFIPTQLKSGSFPTAFKGHDLKVETTVDSSKTDPVTGKANVIPSVVITPEAGKPAKVDLFNIFVGKGIFQGVSGVLMPKLGAATSTEAAKKAPAPAPAAPAAAKQGGRRLLGWALESLTELTAGGRHLLRGGSRSRYREGSSQQYANTIAADNTERAIEAAASGTIPTSYATRYGSNQAKAAAYYGDCLNCYRW